RTTSRSPRGAGSRHGGSSRLGLLVGAVEREATGGPGLVVRRLVGLGGGVGATLVATGPPPGGPLGPGPGRLELGVFLVGDRLEPLGGGDRGGADLVRALPAGELCVVHGSLRWDGPRRGGRRVEHGGQGLGLLGRRGLGALAARQRGP